MLTNKYKTYTSLFITALLSVGLLSVPEEAVADVIGEEECFPAVLLLKGSGEGGIPDPSNPGDSIPVASTTYSPNHSPELDYIHTNGHEGRVLSLLLQSFVNQTNVEETISKVRFIGIEYPALPVFPKFPDMSATNAIPIASAIIANHLVTYDNSYRTGAEMVLGKIKEDQIRGCNTQYMLVSYSQGVISARLAMNLLNNETDKVISSYVIGDPFQKADGVTSSRQMSSANTSPQTDGVGRVASAGLETFAHLLEHQLPVLSPVTQSAIQGMKDYTNEITRADSMIYRDEGENLVVSRSLCHEMDPTCALGAFEGINQNEHTNYFDSNTTRGLVDIEFEIEEFDNQVQTLANSTPSNPRERVLTKTPTISGQVTSYNVANSRGDDWCYWDENSDGTVELSARCGVHNVVHTSITPTMSVRIVDSFGTEHIRNTSSSAIDAHAVKTVTTLDPDKWYQFKPYQVPEDWSSSYPSNQTENAIPCIENWQPSSYVFFDSNRALYKKCAKFTSSADTQHLGQAYQYSSYPTPQGMKNRVLWGYDKNYSWTNKGGWFQGGGEASFQLTSSDSKQDLSIKLTSFINSKGYYTIQQGNTCLTADEIISFSICKANDPKQLFSAHLVEGNFGNVLIQ